ncbi:hypothetical protein MUK42_03296 [Musa troglodytarum]|uniref:Uncharacterized protein n=1 Tax=Musa troglodytarum TaxID=320322 RepID=A0A9E7KQG2_9LILI|nr:hypothetical protein MUK42_03296 [Musa troglodytarum]
MEVGGSKPKALGLKTRKPNPVSAICYVQANSFDLRPGKRCPNTDRQSNTTSRGALRKKNKLQALSWGIIHLISELITSKHGPMLERPLCKDPFVQSTELRHPKPTLFCEGPTAKMLLFSPTATSSVCSTGSTKSAASGTGASVDVARRSFLQS